MSKPPAGIPTADRFVAGGRGKTVMPWEEPHRRDDLRVQFNTRMPERLALQVDWLAREMSLEKQAVVEMALRDFVTREFRKRGVSG